MADSLRKIEYLLGSMAEAVYAGEDFGLFEGTLLKAYYVFPETVEGFPDVTRVPFYFSETVADVEELSLSLKTFLNLDSYPSKFEHTFFSFGTPIFSGEGFGIRSVLVPINKYRPHWIERIYLLYCDVVEQGKFESGYDGWLYMIGYYDTSLTHDYYQLQALYESALRYKNSLLG